jgi:signal transduction histidine kinase
MTEQIEFAGSTRVLTEVLNSGAALVIGREAEILAHRPSLPFPFAENDPLVGRRFRELRPPALGNCLERLWNDCRRSGRSSSAELVIDVAPASPAPPVTLSFRVSAHPDADEIWVVTVRDLTRERDRVQMLLNELENVRAERDEWEAAARAAAHDVRSSLAAMSGFIKLALHPSARVSPGVSDHLSRALEAASRIRSMTELILEREAAKSDSAEHVHIAPFGQRLFRSLQAAHPEVPFTWCVDAGEDPAAIRSDALWEVLWNLLSNAVQYRSPDRPLHIELRAWREAAEIWIEVWDNGRGLTPGEEESIFLFRQRGARVQGTPGSGLGLFSARRLIESCGGRIWAESRPDGAIFRIAVSAWVK